MDLPESGVKISDMWPFCEVNFLFNLSQVCSVLHALVVTAAVSTCVNNFPY